jgi:hypothetical protein
MKTKDWLILIGGVLFAYLFYNQAAGINYALYSFFIIAGLAAHSPQIIKGKNWWLSVVALLVSLSGMILYGSFVSLVSAFFSLMLVAGYSHQPRASAILNFIQTGLAFPLSLPNSFRQGHVAGENKKRETDKKPRNNWFVYIIIFSVFILFVLLYSATSSAFNQLLQQINFSFISFGWIMCTVLGIFVSFALLKNRRIKFIDREEQKLGVPLIAPRDATDSEKSVKTTLENNAGTLLLVLLNVLLLVVNGSDVAFLAGGISANQSLDYSQMVHQGVGALIFSILIAVGIILYFFRGNLNFDEKAKTLQLLALVWILQNLLLTGTGVYKNYLYIDIENGLTYKRVGVFFYLLLASVGLLFTALKIYAKKPNWYLVRVNFIAFFVVLVANSPIDWDIIITRYNIKQAEVRNEDPDIGYLLSLSNRNLPLLEAWFDKAAQNPALLKHCKEWEYNSLAEKFTYKAVRFTEKHRAEGWQSWNVAGHNNYMYLNALNYNKYHITAPDTALPTIIQTPEENGNRN